MLSETQVMEQLKALGSEQTQRIYLNHGACEDVFGVKFAELQKLKKKIKADHVLAQKLWLTGNHEARLLALMIADPQQADGTLLDAWVVDLSDYVVGGALGGFVAQTALAHQKVRQWIQSDDEWISTAGWNTLAGLALNDVGLSDEDLINYLAIIERDIHQAKNRTRYAMNSALIAIGGRNNTLAEHAIAAAKRIGKVHVDHGKTSCKTPDAVPYIQKMRDRAKN